jgi:hypothetical protein
MSQCGPLHLNVGPDGIGRCSVPMWQMGCPAGFCDEPAYGEPPQCVMYRDGWTGRRFRSDGRYDGYVPALACVGHGGPPSRVFMDGNAWCAVFPDFTNLQESPAGFGETPVAARAELKRTTGKATL